MLVAHEECLLGLLRRDGDQRSAGGLNLRHGRVHGLQLRDVVRTPAASKETNNQRTRCEERSRADRVFIVVRKRKIRGTIPDLQRPASKIGIANLLNCALIQGHNISWRVALAQFAAVTELFRECLRLSRCSSFFEAAPFHFSSWYQESAVSLSNRQNGRQSSCVTTHY